MRYVPAILVPVTVFLAIEIVAAQPDESQPTSVNDIMISLITPATNTIWGIEDPQTGAEWQVFIDAAAQVIEATTKIKQGGSGPNDSVWAQDPEWQRYADALIESAREIQAAALNRDLEVLIEVSNYNMYPPCEECHIKFHPGLQEQDSN